MVDYYSKARCGLTSKSIDKVLETSSSAEPKWKELIDISFLLDEMKEKYHKLPGTRPGTMIMG